MALIKIGSNGLDTGVGGSYVKLSSATASGDASVEFTTNLDSSYFLHEFHFYDMSATSDGNNDLLLSFSTDGTNYTVPMYQATIANYNSTAGQEGGFFTSNTFNTENDTNGVLISERFGAGTGESQNGKIIIYEPYSTSKYKFYQTRYSGYHSEDYAWGAYISGFGQTTSALAGVKISIGSGTFNGTIVHYGVKI